MGEFLMDLGSYMVALGLFGLGLSALFLTVDALLKIMGENKDN